MNNELLDDRESSPTADLIRDQQLKFWSLHFSTFYIRKFPVSKVEVVYTDMGRLFLKKYHFLEEEYNLQPLKYHLLSVGEN